MSSKQCFYHGHSADELSEAAVLNKKLMRRLAKALEADPETDLTNILPRRYSSRLARGKVENSEHTSDRIRRLDRLTITLQILRMRIIGSNRLTSP